MATKRLTMGQKSIRGLLMVLILGIQNFKHDENWTIEAETSQIFFSKRLTLRQKPSFFKDGGQTVNYGTKQEKRSIEDLHLR